MKNVCSTYDDSDLPPEGTMSEELLAVAIRPDKEPVDEDRR